MKAPGKLVVDFPQFGQLAALTNKWCGGSTATTDTCTDDAEDETARLDPPHSEF